MATEKLSSIFSRDFLDFCIYKLLFYSFYSAVGPTLGYLSLFFKQIGLNAMQVGLLISIRPFLQTLGSPFAGLLADKYKIRKSIAIFALMAFFARHLGILLVKHPRETCIRTLINSTEQSAFNKTFGEDKQRFKDIFEKQTSDFESQAEIYRRGQHKQTFLPLRKQKITEDEIPHLHEDTATNHTATNARGKSSYIKRRFNKFRLSRQLQALDEFEKRSQNQTSLQNYAIMWDNVEKNRYFVTVLVIIITTELLGSPLSSLIDSGIVELLGENRNDYGKYRLWGSIGIGSSALLTGAVIQASSVYYYCKVLHKNYYLMFYIVFGFSFLTLFPLLFSKHVYSEAEETREKPKSEGISKLKILFCSIKNVTFWMTVLSLAILDGFQMDFGPWFMDDLGTSPVMIGMATAMHFAINSVTFVLSPYVINRFGHMCVLSFGLFADIVVFILFSVAQSSWFAVVLFSLSGFVPSLTWSCGVSYVAMVSSPVGIVTTSEGLYNAIYTGIGISFGTVTGGNVIRILGIRAAFQVLAGLSAFTVVTMNILLYIDKKLSVDSSYQTVPKTDEDEQ